MVQKYPCDIAEKEKMEIFINNLNSEMSYQLKLKYLPTFTKLIKNGIQVEEVCIKKVTLRLSKDDVISLSNNTYSNQYNNNNSNKSKFWTRNKNVVNDGVVDPNNVKSKKPVLTLSSNTQSNNDQRSANQGTNSYQRTTSQGASTSNNNNNNNQGNNNYRGNNNNYRGNNNNNHGGNANTPPPPYRRIYIPLGQTLESSF